MRSVVSGGRSQNGPMTIPGAGDARSGENAGREGDASFAADAENMLDALAHWDERYHQGEDLPVESLGLRAPALVDELRGRIERQKRLYALLDHPQATTDGSAGSGDPLPMFPGHETLSRIGHGGMGIVYKARDQKLGRVVAIKTIAGGLGASRAQVGRFRAEAEAVARLKHPNVIPIYAIGEHEGRPYFSLEYADGGSLAQRLNLAPIAAAAAAGLIEAIALAVHAAHGARIVHRDLKPSNVLLSAEGIPKVSDFGVAKLLDSDSARTLSGEALGTPSYMAPEQADGHSKEVRPAADIYALGAILYQSLTGRPPFLGESAIETLRLVVSTDVVPPRRLRPDVPPDLETICLKCLEKSQAHRYATALELADDLGRVQRGLPIQARRIGAVRRSIKWATRHPSLTGLAASVLLALSAVIGLTYRYNVRLRDEIGRTQAKSAEARHNYQQARSTIITMLGRLDDRRFAGSPRLLDLRRDQQHDALAFYDRILGQVESNDPLVRFDTAIALAGASALQHALGQTDKAETSILRAIGLTEKLRSEDPRDLGHVRLQIDCLLKLCSYLNHLRQRDRAIAAGRAALELAERVIQSRPDDVECQEELALCHHNLGTALSSAERWLEADHHFQKAIEVRERIDPEELPGVTWRLAQSLTNRGVGHWQADAYARAEADFRRAESVLLSIATDLREPDRGYAFAIGHVNVNWGGMLHLLGRWDEAIARADAGLRPIESYLLIEPSDREVREICLKLHGNRAYALSGKKRHRDAACDWERVVELSPKPVSPNHLIRLALELLRAGEMPRAKAQARLLKPAAGISGEDCYNLACVWALLAAPTIKDVLSPGIGREPLAKPDIANALQWLNSAARAGFFRDPANREHARKDPDLAILAGRADFQELIASSETTR